MHQDQGDRFERGGAELRSHRNARTQARENARTQVLIAFIILVCLSSCARERPPEIAIHSEATATRPLPFPRIHFATASAKILKTQQGPLAENAQWMIENPDVVFVLEGHCDERGSDNYNIKLGDQRARSVKALLQHEGVDVGRRTVIVSHGERKPLDPRHTPEAWRKNRRVEFIMR